MCVCVYKDDFKEGCRVVSILILLLFTLGISGKNVMTLVFFCCIILLKQWYDV